LLEPLEAYQERKRTYVPRADHSIELRERGFGHLKGNRIFLSPYETFYLVEKGRIRVVAQKRREELSLRDLVKKLSVGKPEVWIKYLVYRDLRDRGYIVREAPEVDFEVHGKGPLRRLVSIIYEGREASLEKLHQLLCYATRERKELVLAVIDRRTDIVYYTLSSLKI
jgi:tRNA-intron endonuclease